MRIEKGEGWELRNSDCLDPNTGLYSLESVDSVITDPPYSERTHKGHDAAPASNRSAGDYSDRAQLGYLSLSPVDAEGVADTLAHAVDSWAIVFCDHILAHAWEKGLREGGLYVFAPLPYVAPGSRVRLQGDGPSCWTTWIVAARTKAASKWGTLPGAYVRSPGWDKPIRMGGKPLALMEALVRDYSRQGDLICDPFAGAGTTGVAAIRLGRRFIGWEIDEPTFDIACARLRKTRTQGDLFERTLGLVSQDRLEGID